MRVDAPRGLIDELEDARQFPGVFLRIVRMVGRVVVRRRGVHVLAVQLESLIAVFADELLHEPLGFGPDIGIFRGKIPAVPPGDVHGLSVLVQDHRVGMLLEELRAGIGSERRPPQIGLQAILVDLVHHVFHVGVPARETIRVEIPVAFRDLVAVIERRPLEAQFLHLGQGAHDLVDGEQALVTPGAPGRFEGIRLALGHDYAHAFQQLRIMAQGTETVALEHMEEGRIRLQRGAVFQHHGRIELLHDGNGRFVLPGLLFHRQAHPLRDGLQMADGQAGIPAPEASDGRAATVVGAVHAHEVLLIERIRDGENPIRPSLRRLTLEAPEGGCRFSADDIETVHGPAFHRQRGARGIGKGCPRDHGAREAIIGRQRQSLQDLAFRQGRFALENKGCSLSESVVDGFLLGPYQLESGRLPVQRQTAESHTLLYEGEIGKGRRDGETHPFVHSHLHVAAYDRPVPGATGRQQQGGADQSKCQPFHIRSCYFMRSLKNAV